MTPGLKDFQMSLGRHVRDPKGVRRPAGVDRRRVGIYNELVFNNLEGLLRPCFPVSRAMLGARWPRLVRQFCREARCHTPLFREVAGEFLQWVLQAETTVALPPWWRELAHYEWAELAVDVMDVQVEIAMGADARPPAQPRQVLRVNPSLLNLHYQWPVHRIGPGRRPRKPAPTCLLVYRDRRDEVRFMEVQPASARLLHLLSQDGTTVGQACAQVAAELGQTEPQQVAQVLQAGLDQIQQWMESDVIEGSTT